MSSFESLSTSEITIAAGAEPSFTVVAAKDVAELYPVLEDVLLSVNEKSPVRRETPLVLTRK